MCRFCAACRGDLTILQGAPTLPCGPRRRAASELAHQVVAPWELDGGAAGYRSAGEQAPHQSLHAPLWCGGRTVTTGPARGSGLRGQTPLVYCAHAVTVAGLHQIVLKRRVHRGLLAAPGLWNDRLLPACQGVRVTVSHPADTAPVSLPTPDGLGTGLVLAPARW